MKPPRKIVTRSPHRRVGYVPCPWLQHNHVGYESLLEASFIRIALLCPNLQELHHQPFRLDLAELGTYTPDFLLKCHSFQNLVVEVKPSGHVAKHAKKLHAAQQILKEKGCQFLLCTEVEIYGDERGERAGQILRPTRSFLPATMVNQIVRRLPEMIYPISADALAAKLGISLQQVLYLVGRRYLQAPSDLRTDELYYTASEEIGNGNFSARAWIGSAAW